MSQSRVGARIPDQLRKRLDRANATTNQGDTPIIVAALEEFFLRYKSPEKIISAVLASVRRSNEHG